MSPVSPVRSGRTILGLLLAFALLLPAVTVRLNASDEIEYFAWLRSWVFDRDIDFDNEYRHFHDQDPDKHEGLRATFIDAVNEAGRRPNFAPVGTAILWIPFYVAGHLAAGVTDDPQDGFSRPYIAAVAFGSALYGVLSLVLAMDLTRRLFRVPAGLAAWSVWLGSPLLFYMYVAPGFSHATSAFAVALFLWTWAKVRTAWAPSGVLLLGLTAGLLPMVREQDVFFVIGPALDFVVWAWRGRPGSARSAISPERLAGRLALGSAAAATVYLPQVFAYVALNGHFGPTTAVSRKMSWSSPHFLQVVASPEHGFFFWTPLALISCGALAWHAWTRRPDASGDHRWLAALLLLMVALQVYVSGAVESWTVAGSFGQRRFVGLTPVLVSGMALAMASAASRRPRQLALATLVGVAVWWNIGLMAQFGLHLMDRQRLELGRNIATTFVRLPREAPAIVWRYWTDRESFYDLPRQD